MIQLGVVDGDAERIEIEVRWGRYERSDEHEIFRTRKNKETGSEEQAKAKWADVQAAFQERASASCASSSLGRSLSLPPSSRNSGSP